MDEARDFEVIRYEAGSETPGRESRRLIAEESLLLQVENGPAWNLTRTPGRDSELIAGFLLSEGVAAAPKDILSISESPGRALVSLSRICEPIIPPAVGGGAVFAVKALYAVPGRVRARQVLFRETGASHGAALFDAEGNILASAEDLSRHCALDKVIGEVARSGGVFGNVGVFLTGRVSAGMVIKAARVGIPLIAAVSAASAAAAERALDLGLTLAGFVRGDEITIYTRPERIVGAGQGGPVGPEK